MKKSFGIIFYTIMDSIKAEMRKSFPRRLCTFSHTRPKLLKSHAILKLQVTYRLIKFYTFKIAENFAGIDHVIISATGYTALADLNFIVKIMK